MFSLLLNSRKNADATAAEQERAALVRRDEARARVAAALSALRLQSVDERTRQIDLHEAVRVLLLLHMYNANARRYLWRAIAQNVTRLDTLLANDARLAAFGTRDGDVAVHQPLPAQLWIDVFTLMRLPAWNIDLEAERIVLQDSYSVLRPRPSMDAVADTSDMVQLYKLLYRVFIKEAAQRSISTSSTTIMVNVHDLYLRRDLVLLYFVRCALLHKNAREVLAHAHFNYLEPGGGRQLMYETLLGADAQMERAAVDDRDFMVRVRPIELCWEGVLRMLNVDMDSRYQEEQQGRRVTITETQHVTPAATAPPPPPPRGEKEEEEGDEFISGDGDNDELDGGELALAADEEAAAEEEEGEADGSTQLSTTTTTATALVTPDDSAVDKMQAAIASNVDAASAQLTQLAHQQATQARCSYHNQCDDATLTTHACTAQCVSARMGAPIAALSDRVTQSAVVRANAFATHNDERKAAGMALVQALTAQTPRARENILRTVIGAECAQAVHPVRNNTEWVDLIHSLVEHKQCSVADEHVEALSRYCGWQQRPMGEQLARYATVYGTLQQQQRNDVFVRMGWRMDDKMSARIDTFVTRHPVVPLRTLQVLAQLYSC